MFSLRCEVEGTQIPRGSVFILQEDSFPFVLPAFLLLKKERVEELY